MSMVSALEALDIEALQGMWARDAHHLPQLSAAAALVSAHMARTQSSAVAFRCRAYSHSWLLEHGYPSQLPDGLKPRAQRIYPVIVNAVGISVNMRSPIMRPAVGEVRGAMEYAVLEAEADGKLLDHPHVKRRMGEARRKTLHKLFG